MIRVDYILELDTIVDDEVTFSWRNGDKTRLVISRRDWEFRGRPAKVAILVEERSR